MPEDEYTSWLPGLQYAETRGQQDPFTAVGDAGQAHGAYQMHPIMYRDIQQTYPAVWGKVSYAQMLATPALQTAAAHDGLKMLHERYKLSDDAMISAWNTGPTAARKGIFNQKYVDTVKQGRGNPTLKKFRRP